MYIRVEKNNKWGYIDPETGNSIECTYLRAYNFDGGFAIVQDANYKYGVINYEGKTVIPFKYRKLEKISDQVYRAFVNNITGLISVERSLLDNEQCPFSDSFQGYDLVSSISPDLYIIAEDGLLGVIHKDTITIPIEYDTISLIDNEHFKVQKEDYSYYGVLDISGHVIVPIEYNEVGRFNSSVLYGEKYGWDCYSNEGVFTCRIDNNYGKIKNVKCLSGDLFSVDYDGVVFNINLLEGKVLLSDGESVIKLDVQYDCYWPVLEGLCKVIKKTKIGYIDKEGNELIPCEYDVIDFCGDFAYLRKVDKGRGFHRKDDSVEVFSLKQKKLITSKAYRAVSEFKDGYAIVQSDYSNYGIINSDGLETIPTQYKKIEETDEPGVVYVEDYIHNGFHKKSGELLFKNTLGQYLPAPSKIKTCWPFSEGLALVINEDHKYGFINEQGVIVIPCRFESRLVFVSSFNDGRASLILRERSRYFANLDSETCALSSSGNFLIQHEGQLIEIHNDNLAFIFPFEGNIARAVSIDGKWGLISLNGNTIGSFEFSGIFPFHEQEAIVEKDRLMGVVRSDGSIAVPVKFSEVVRDGLLYVSKEGELDNNGHFYINGTLFNSTEYDECLPYEESFIRLKHNGKYGLAGSDGRIIVPCEYDAIGKLENNYVFCRNSTSPLLASSSGDTILLPKDTIRATCFKGGYICAENAKKQRCILNNSGDILINNYENEVKDVRYGLIIFASSSYYTWIGVQSIDGSTLISPANQTIRFDEIKDTFVVCKDGYEQRYNSLGKKVAYNNGVLFALDSCYTACGDFHEGLARVSRVLPVPKVREFRKRRGSFGHDILWRLLGEKVEIKEDDGSGNKDYIDTDYSGPEQEKTQPLWGYINLNGEEVIRCQFVKADDFSCGLACVSYKDYYGYIDASGVFVIPRSYRFASKFVDGLARIKGDSWDSEGLINTSGEYVSKKSDYDYVSEFKDGLSLVKKRNGGYGYLNEKGEVAIPFVFSYAESFINGEAKVSFLHSKDKEKERYIIDKYGHLIVENRGQKRAISVDLGRFSNLGRFYDGVALLTYYFNERGLITEDGKLLAEPSDRYIRINPDGRWYIETDHHVYFLTPDGKEFKDNTGKTIRANKNAPTSDLLATDRYLTGDVDNKGVRDGAGRIIVPCSYSDIELSSDKKHFICFRTDYEHESWDSDYNIHYLRCRTVYNLDGRKVILYGEEEIVFDKEYDSYRDFLPNGLAPVMKDGLWGFIDSSLNEVIECKYQDYDWIDDNYCVLTCGEEDNEKKALINNKGDFILTPGNYKDIGAFKDGRATVSMYSFYHQEPRKGYDSESGEEYTYKENIYDERLIDENGRLVIETDNETYFFDKKYKWYITNKDGSFSVYDGVHWGLLSTSFEVLIPCIYSSKFCYNGSFAVVEKETGKGVIDTSQKQIMGFEYDSIAIHPDVSVIYGWKENTVSVFNTNGTEMTTLDCDNIYPLSGNYSAFNKLKNRESRWSGVQHGILSHKDGRTFEGFDDIGHESEGFISVRKSGKWGFVDLNGEIVIPCDYKEVGLFINGKARVSKMVDKKDIPGYRKKRESSSWNRETQLWGMIDRDGSTIIPIIYSYLKYLKDTNNQILVATYDGIDTYLNTQGYPLSVSRDNHLVSIPGYYACQKNFVGSHILVYKENGIGAANESGQLIVDCRDFGKIVLDPAIQKDDTIIVGIKESYDSVIKKTMNQEGSIVSSKNDTEIALPFKYIFAKEWVGSYLPVLCGDSWGVIDDSLNEVIPCIYQELFIAEGKAIVKTDAGYSIIDIVTKETIDLQYDKVSPLYGNFLLVLKKKENKKSSSYLYGLGRESMEYLYGVIDLTGSVVFAPDYYEITTLNEEPESDEEEEDDDYEDDNHSYEDDSPSYGKYAGTYAQDVAGLSDDVIDDAFEGDPDMYWNID